MKTKQWIAVIALALGASFAQAADWQVVSPGEDESVFVDSDSVHSDGGLKKAWVLRNYSQVKTLGDDAFPHKSEMILYAFRCEAGEAGYAQWSFHSGELGSGRTVWADNVAHVSMIDASFDPALNRVFERVCHS